MVITETSLNNHDSAKEESLQANVCSLLAYKIDYDRNGNEKSKKILQTVRNFEIIM